MLRSKPSKLGGRIAPPPSKSQSLRALLFASLAKGISVIENLLQSPDCEAMKRGCTLLGATFEEGEPLVIKGCGGRLQIPVQVIDVGNSGITLRFLMGVTALLEGATVFTGDASIRSQRSVQPLIEGLNQLGVMAFSTRGNGLAPVVVKGPLMRGEVRINGQDSQPVSALLIALSLAKNPSILEVDSLGERPWVDLTLHWLSFLGAPISREGDRFFFPGGGSFQGFHYRVPADLSSFAFPLVGAMVTDGTVLIEGLDLKDPQGDKKILSLLKEMGGQFEVGDTFVKVCGRGVLRGITADINDCIDALPLLAVAATFAKGRTRLLGASVARGKESNRIQAICSELSKMGANIIEEEDGVCIEGGELKGAQVSSYGDHRMAMSLAVAGLGATGETVIDDISCIDKTYPKFVEAFQQLGANFGK